MKICQKGFSQEEIDSSNILLSLMKQIEDVRILRFISLVKPLLPNNKTRTISFSLIFKISRSIALRSSRSIISLIKKILAAHKKVIGLFCFKGTTEQWVHSIFKIMFEFMFSEMGETKRKTCQ